MQWLGNVYKELHEAVQRCDWLVLYSPRYSWPLIGTIHRTTQIAGPYGIPALSRGTPLSRFRERTYQREPQLPQGLYSVSLFIGSKDSSRDRFDYYFPKKDALRNGGCSDLLQA